MSRILIHASHGAEDPERATLPWIFGTKALLAGQEVAMMLTIEAVRLVTPGEAFDAPGFIRISYATSMDNLREGSRRLLAFVEAHAARSPRAAASA